MRQRRNGERGSQMVEFALIAPVLLYLVLSIPVFAVFARNWLVISAAARDGARAASLYGVGDRANQAINVASNSVARSLGTREQYDVTPSFQGDMIVVSVTYHQPAYLPALSFFLNPTGKYREGTVPLTATARFVVEGS